MSHYTAGHDICGPRTSGHTTCELREGVKAEAASRGNSDLEFRLPIECQKLIEILHCSHYNEATYIDYSDVLNHLVELSRDACRYRFLRDSYQDNEYLLTDFVMKTWKDELGMTIDSSLDDLVDAAMARDREE